MPATDEDREYLEDLRNEQQYAFREHAAGSSVPFAEDGKIAKYLKFVDYGYDGDEYNVVYVDRTTGQQALKYDGADPANTNPFYGAQPDSHYIPDIKKMIHPSKQKVSDEEIKRGYYLEPRYDDSHWD